eukprot:gene15923-biopygen7566
MQVGRERAWRGRGVNGKCAWHGVEVGLSFGTVPPLLLPLLFVRLRCLRRASARRRVSANTIMPPRRRRAGVAPDDASSFYRWRGGPTTDGGRRGAEAPQAAAAPDTRHLAGALPRRGALLRAGAPLGDLLLELYPPVAPFRAAGAPMRDTFRRPRPSRLQPTSTSRLGWWDAGSPTGPPLRAAL